jgi:hypothetical protein
MTLLAKPATIYPQTKQGWAKNMVIGPTGPETKNDCAGECQQQITRPDEDHSQSVMNSVLTSLLSTLCQIMHYSGLYAIFHLKTIYYFPY